MSTNTYSDTTTGSTAVTGRDQVVRNLPVERLETKPSVKTSELFVYLAAVAGVLIGSLLVKATDGHRDYFRADQAWLYVTLLTIGYLVSRGLAKSGSTSTRDPR